MKMRHTVFRVIAWMVLYVVLAALPLGVALLGAERSGRGFWVELGVAVSMVGFAMMGLQFATTARFHWVAPFFGSDAMLQFHRQTGILAFFLILAHPVILFVADPRFLEYLDPRENFPRVVALSTAMVGTMLLVVLPLWRLKFRLNYEWWRLTHGLLAALVILIGLVHALMVGHYVAGLWKQAFWVGMTVCFLVLLIHVRLVKPAVARRRPYRIHEVRPELGPSWTLVLEPEGHDGMNFIAGQYAWITTGDTPFSLQQNPFSFSSSARSRQLEFTMKEFGDFTRAAKNLSSGTRAFLEGPYGSFVLAPEAPGAVLIMGGIGVTPAMSILRTCRDDGDRRPLVLIYGNTTWDEAVFRDEIDELTQHLNLRVIHVLEEAPEGWQGEEGFITAEVLDRHLSEAEEKFEYLVCGPDPMMDMAEQALIERGVPLPRLLAERFDIV